MKTWMYLALLVAGILMMGPQSFAEIYCKYSLVQGEGRDMQKVIGDLVQGEPLVVENREIAGIDVDKIFQGRVEVAAYWLLFKTREQKVHENEQKFNPMSWVGHGYAEQMQLNLESAVIVPVANINEGKVQVGYIRFLDQDDYSKAHWQDAEPVEEAGSVGDFQAQVQIPRLTDSGLNTETFPILIACKKK